MIRILVYVALVFAIAAGFAWLADRPGDIALSWQGYDYSTSLMVAAVALAALFVALALVLWLILAAVRAPRLFGGWLSGRKRDRGYRALSRGMIAIGAGDLKRAKRFSTEAQKILQGEPLTLLLAAQTAQLSGDGAGARAAFETMLNEPETRLLGLRGLYVEAQRSGEHEAARHYAEEAAKAAPSLGWAGTALFDDQAAHGEWSAALTTLGSNLHAKLIDRGSAHRLRAVLLTARGLELELSNPEEARAAAQEAAKLQPGLVPAATLAARLFTRQGDIKRAVRILETAWRHEPHPELAEAYGMVRAGDSAQDRLKRAQRLLTLRPGHVESHLAVARAAIDARDWPLARKELATIAETDRTERFCLLMAEIEEGPDGNRGHVREWLSRALRAPRDPQWTADGYVFPAWAPISPISGRLDAFEWRTPTAALADDQRPAIDLVVADDVIAPEPRVIDATPAQAERAAEAARESRTSAPQAPRPAAPEASPPPPPPTKNGGPEKPVVVPPIPDDPGIEDVETEPSDRLRLQ
ncbi:heme biosynthesis protein HemY [Kaistia granuli]|uniref:heme biosynthesis protein HemY n=1 Tax=Kaistia granuli TaxID=363259 RepID=UPI000369B01D|nr:heme biosynthesis HemY N-terminal domain-containing protein [Kaistia granuli]